MRNDTVDVAAVTNHQGQLRHVASALPTGKRVLA